MNGWTAKHYGLFRAAFGIYLTIHFLGILPYANELFGPQMMPASDSPFSQMFGFLAWFDLPFAPVIAVGAATLLSSAFALGIKDRGVAIVLWVVWASLFARNPLIANPGIPYVGWLLLFHAALPRPMDKDWRLPHGFYHLAWVVMAVGYSYSGITKLGSASWLDGTALSYVLNSPLARPTFLRDLLVASPLVMTVMTYATLGLEVLAAPVAIFKRARPWVWLALTGLQIGILVTIDFADLTWGMLMIHLLTFDPAWLRGFGRQTK